jgi:N-acetylmuramoyl-L-alanine amidase
MSVVAALLAAAVGYIVMGQARHAHVVALDVGHTQAKPGVTSARGVPEFELNRELALAVRDELVARLFEVRMIGDDGQANDLWARAQAAAGADLLLSIHHDSAQKKYLEMTDVDGKQRRVTRRFAGFSIFVSRKNRLLEPSLTCASALGAALREVGMKPSPHHAEPIAGENRPFADQENGVHYYDDLIVLKTARVPAVLVEAGVIVNPDEELVLRSPETRRKIARAIADALRCLD